jgi:ABC-type oligopeptide transport system ATPase subunit
MTAAPVCAPLVEITGLTKTYRVKGGVLRAVDSVTLAVESGTTLGLVGESGSGKTTLGRCILRLMKWDHGDIKFSGASLKSLRRQDLKSFRRQVQAVFQNPQASLNPRMRTVATLEEPLKLHTQLDRDARRQAAHEALERVQLSARYGNRFPAELSGGEQQRVAIARAIITRPQLIVLDEPTAALDAALRREIYVLLADLQRELQLTYVLITHDMAAVRSVAHRMAVMKTGRIVEAGPRAELFASPQHPYTAALIAAVPAIALDRRRVRRSGVLLVPRGA